MSGLPRTSKRTVEDVAPAATSGSNAPGRERGAAAVEFALVMPILLLIVFGLVQYGWYFYSMQAGTAAAGDVARRLSVGDCQDPDELAERVRDRLGSATSSPFTVETTVTYTDTAIGNPEIEVPGVVGGDVTVTVRFRTQDFGLPFIPLPDDGVVTRAATARVEDTVPSVGGC